MILDRQKDKKTNKQINNSIERNKKMPYETDLLRFFTLIAINILYLVIKLEYKIKQFQNLLKFLRF